MTVIPMEAEEIKNATAAILAGASLRSIVKDLNKRAIPTSTGNTWEASEIRRVLLRPRNAGILVHRGKEAGPGQWPAILDEGEWRSMCAILTDPDRRTTPGNERKYLGSNIYVCGKCGAKMRCSTTQKTPQGVTAPSYACRAFRHVLRRIKTVDDYVVLAILERVSRPDANALFVKRQDPVDVQGVQQDMRAARSTLDDLAKALGAGEMDMQEWRTASQAARRRLETAENLLSRAVQANPVLGLVNAEDPEAEWNRLDLSRRRAVLQHLMTVTVLPTGPGRKAGGGYFDPDALRIEWK